MLCSLKIQAGLPHMCRQSLTGMFNYLLYISGRGAVWLKAGCTSQQLQRRVPVCIRW